jgi:hypothetical protein
MLFLGLAKMLGDFAQSLEPSQPFKPKQFLIQSYSSKSIKAYPHLLSREIIIKHAQILHMHAEV